MLKIRRFAQITALAAVAAGALVVGTVSPAQAANAPAPLGRLVGWTLGTSGDLRCMEIGSGRTDDAVVHQATCKRNFTGGLRSNQLWQADAVPGTTVEHKDSETFATVTLRNGQSGKCLTAYPHALLHPSELVIQSACVPGLKTQQWHFGWSPWYSAQDPDGMAAVIWNIQTGNWLGVDGDPSQDNALMIGCDGSRNSTCYNNVPLWRPVESRYIGVLPIFS
jgi:hypothetical protein